MTDLATPTTAARADAAPRRRRSLGLRRVLRIDAAVTVVIALFLMIDAVPVAERIGASPTTWRVVGAVLLAVAAATAAVSYLPFTAGRTGDPLPR